MLVINALSWAADMFMPSMTGYSILSILSIHYHASLDAHAYCAINTLLPSLGTSYIILIGAVFVLATLALLLVKRYDFVTSEGDQS